MTVAVIKAITKRIRLRYGSTEAAASAAGISPGVWSGYENADKPETTIPLGRLLDMSLSGDERGMIVSLFADEAADAGVDLRAEVMEAGESLGRLTGSVRLATEGGQPVSETSRRRILAEALDARAQIDDVIQGVGQ